MKLLSLCCYSIATIVTFIVCTNAFYVQEEERASTDHLIEAENEGPEMMNLNEVTEQVHEDNLLNLIMDVLMIDPQRYLNHDLVHDEEVCITECIRTLLSLSNFTKISGNKD